MAPSKAKAARAPTTPLKVCTTSKIDIFPFKCLYYLPSASPWQSVAPNQQLRSPARVHSAVNVMMDLLTTATSALSIRDQGKPSFSSSKPRRTLISRPHLPQAPLQASSHCPCLLSHGILSHRRAPLEYLQILLNMLVFFNTPTCTDCLQHFSCFSVREVCPALSG